MKLDFWKWLWLMPNYLALTHQRISCKILFSVGSVAKDGSREVTEFYLCPNPCLCCSIRNLTENNIIENLATGDFVWIGLHRDKQWSDGSPSLFRHWASEQPDSGVDECITMSFNDSGRWSDDVCSLQVPFICYKPSNAYKPCIICYISHRVNITTLTNNSY